MHPFPFHKPFMFLFPPMIRVPKLLPVLFLLVSTLPAWSLESPDQTHPHVRVSLVTDRNAITPGESFTVGVRYRMEPGWHIYWKNYGETGIPTTIDWVLPDGFEAGPLRWPTPETYKMGSLMNYVYEEEVVLMAEVTAPADLQPGESIPVGATTSWLVCEEICVPGDAELALSLPVREASELDPDRAALIQTYREQWPRTSDSWEVRGEVREDVVTLLLTPLREGLPALQDLYFFSENSAIDPGAEQRVDAFDDGSYRMVLNVSSYYSDPLPPLPGVLRSSTGWEAEKAFKGLSVRPLATGPATAAEAPGESALPGTGPEPAVGFLQAAVFAVFGGLLLNLMPCVFPVLGLKIMGFVSQGGEDPGRIRMHGIVFSLGVFLSLWILVGVLVALRAAGDRIGWGFQLQDPRFVAFIVFLFFAFGLNLAGVFEIGNRLVGTGSGLTARKGFSGSFFSGILAVIVATPCTAPFMGVAIGVALGTSTALTFLLFTLLGFGLVLPYLVLSFLPGLVRKLPRPGAWMESFKQFMAFPLFATAIYFLWVYGAQLGKDALINLLTGLLILGFGLWVFGRWGAPHRKPAVRYAAFAFAAVLALGGVGYGVRDQLLPGSDAGGERIAGLSESNSVIREQGVEWLVWSPERVEELRAEGKTLYVDFTAAWCLTCQANKKAVFSSQNVRDRFNNNPDLLLLKADWTSRDPVISDTLESYGRSGVPFNLIYPPAGEPVILPAALTPAIVMNALDQVQTP